MPSYIRPQTHDDRSIALQELMAARPSMEGQCSPLIGRLRSIVPFDGFSFSGLDIEGCHVGQGVYLTSSFSADFRDIYTRERLIEVDPLARLIREDQPIARWEAIDSNDLKRPGAQRLSRIMKQYDIAPRTGITLWNRGWSYGAAMFTRKRPFTDDELATLGMFAPVLHSALAKPVIAAINQRLSLTTGEVLCLKLASEGLTSDEIARESPFTVQTVTTYLKAAIKKLKAQNRAHAIAEAIRRKIIA